MFAIVLVAPCGLLLIKNGRCVQYGADYRLASWPFSRSRSAKFIDSHATRGLIGFVMDEIILKWMTECCSAALCLADLLPNGRAAYALSTKLFNDFPQH